MYDKFVAKSFFHLQNCAKIKNVQNTPNEVFWTSMSKTKNVGAGCVISQSVVKSEAFNGEAARLNYYGRFIITVGRWRVNSRLTG